MPPRFVHLRLHTEYSLSDGLVRIKALVKRAAKLNMPAVAVTDQGNLFALVKFYKAATGAGIKPIAGADVWLVNDNDIAAPYRLTLLVKDAAGYGSLTELISRGYLDGQHQGVPMLRTDWLAEHRQGLIVLSGGREGQIGQALLAGRLQEAEQVLQRYLEWFPDSFFLELQRTGRPQEEAYIDAAVELAARLDAPVVATNDVRFLDGDEFEAHEARVCIHQGRVLDDPHRPRTYSEQQYLRSPEEMLALFADIPSALENSVEIAKRCNLELTLGKPVLPDFPVPEGMTPEQFFDSQARQGLAERLVQYPPKGPVEPYWERLDIELSVILQMGFPGYFLIVADFIQWAKKEGIPVGPGRGSGAGSLVAYALKITDLDPLEFDLLFERFLNPERVSMPDFDIDFCMERRDEVIDYVARKYGRERVSQIITYGSMAAKAVVRDVGRVLGHPYGFVDRLAKLIPFELGITLEKALKDSEDLRKQYQDDEEVHTLIDLAMKLEGLSRNAGKHAGGVVIAPTRLVDFAPLYCEAGGSNLVTQFDKDDVEAVGLVKFDFLGLRTLTIIDWAVQTINHRRAAAGEAGLDITQIPRDDPASYALLKRYATTAVFQLESRGMKDLIRRLQPDCFEDIIALVALFRPGPLQSGMVDDFVARKHGKAKVDYPHPSLEGILKPTYGVIVYQEQVMQIAQVLAGYTLGGADLLRRAMGKKKPEEMAKQRDIFVSGATGLGVQETTATYIFDLMEKFAEYGFNKSHSAAYALVAYQTAWLKAHYPAEFMAAVLSADMDNTDKVVVLIEECRDMGLKVAAPDINRSEFRFTALADGSAGILPASWGRDHSFGELRTGSGRSAGERPALPAILYGLGAVKGVGESAISDILAERQKNGPFQSLIDLCCRVDGRKANRRVLEALIKSGTFDSLDPNRAQHMAELPTAMKTAEQHHRMGQSGQEDLFGLGPALPELNAPQHLAAVEPWPEDLRLAEEKATLGLYLTGHPIDRYEQELSHVVTARLNQIAELAESRSSGGQGYGRNRGNEQPATVAGLVMDLRTRQNKQGKRMAFAVLDDRTGRLEVAVFAEVFDKYQSLLSRDCLVVAEGSLGVDDFSNQPRLSAERLYSIDEARERHVKQLLIRWPDGLNGQGPAMVRELCDLIAPFQGGACPIGIEYAAPHSKTLLRLGDAWHVRPVDALLQRLEKRYGTERVKLNY